MSYLRKNIDILLLLLFVLIGSASCKTDEPTYKPSQEDLPKASMPRIEGTFIQDWLIASWDDARWEAEFDMLKSVGIKFVILAPTLHGNKEEYTTIYPSDLSFAAPKYGVDLVDKCLSFAAKHGMKVFLGLNMHETWWNAADIEPSWLAKQMNYGNLLAKDLFTKYKSKYPDSFYGWYWVWEIDNVRWNNPYAHKRLVHAMNINFDYLKKMTPDMPVMISPFFKDGAGSIDMSRKMWDYIINHVNFKEGDVFAPQDGVGAGSVSLEILEAWFAMLKPIANGKNGLRFWANTEIFTQYEQEFATATLDRVVRQMNLVYPHVDRIISFAYTHYYSPLLKKSGFHEVYKHYLQSNSIDLQLPIQAPRNVRVEKSSDTPAKLSLYWDEPESKDNVMGYKVFRGQTLLKDLQYDAGGICANFILLGDQAQGHTYSVVSYNAIGQMSEKIAVNY